MDPVAAYDRIAPEFGRISERRRAYLECVERLVIAEMGVGARSLLDIGAGDGRRAMRIARAGGVSETVLLEPSAEMRRGWPAEVTAWAMRAEDLHQKQGAFDVVLCLWNVLGHLFPAQSRREVLRQMARLLAPDGRAFVDVNHRYNAGGYGVLPTALRLVRDLVLPRESNGDVVARWDVDGSAVATRGHVFTDAEFRSLLRGSGLEVEKRLVVDYATGELRGSSFQGNLFYVLRARR